MHVERYLDRGSRALYHLLQVAAIVFCLAPAALIFGLSFFRDVFTNFPPHEITIGLYRELIHAHVWRHAVLVSFKLGVPTALLVVLAVAPVVVALDRSRIRGRAAIEFAMLLPLLMPVTGYAVALYIIYLKLHWVGDFGPLLLAEAVVASPVAFLVLRSALERIPRGLDFVAMSLGASRPRALWDVSIHLLRPAMFVAALFALVHVFDDVLYITFLGGPSTVTVSKAIFDSIEYSLDPVVAALSAVFMVFMAIVIVTATLMRGRARPGGF
ncbi:MAG TPA: ABC transporter permease subunit [Gaiellaceae bacterium]